MASNNQNSRFSDLSAFHIPSEFTKDVFLVIQMRSQEPLDLDEDLFHSAAQEVFEELHEELLLGFGFGSQEYSFLLRKSKKTREIEETTSRISSLLAWALGKIKGKLEVEVEHSESGNEKGRMGLPLASHRCSRAIQEKNESRKLVFFIVKSFQFAKESDLKKFLHWRQNECYHLCLERTCLGMLREKGKLSFAEAQEALRKNGTIKDKNELLFSNFGYNFTKDTPEFKRKGVILLKKDKEDHFGSQKETEDICKSKEEEKSSGEEGKEQIKKLEGERKGGNEPVRSSRTLRVSEEVHSDKFWKKYFPKGLQM